MSDARGGAHARLGTPEYFEEIHRASPDPFGLGDRWYELRKRAILLSMLPNPRYRRAFEAGCSVGTLSVTLAERCDEVVAMDRSEAAVAEARRVVADLALGHVRVHAGVLPKEWPVGPFDLVVLGEVGYYLSEDALAATLRAAAATLDPAGHLVAAHWRHAIEGCSLTGDDVHTRLRAVTGLVHLARYEEEHFLIDVLGRGPSGKSGLPRPE